MAARNIFRVFLKAGKWQVSRDGKDIGTYSQRKEAEQVAQNLATELFSSQVLIYRNFGSIEKSFSNFRFIKKIVPVITRT
jgi:hypothetical protein